MNTGFLLRNISSICLLFSLISCQNRVVAQNESELARIKLPKGFHISYYAKNIKDARSMILGPKGTLFVGSRSAGNVYAIVDTDHDGVADKTYIVAKNMDNPNGVAFYNGSLYIATISRIWRLEHIEDNLATPPTPALVYAGYPDKAHHGWKYIAFGPDNKLYVPVGAPCNNCNDAEKDPRYASITRMNPDGSGFEIFAHGIRNTVGFAWHPETKELWFTENGRDMLGENLPPDELNHAPKAGMNFGYPYCHAGYIKDPDGNKHSCDEFTAPDIKLGPHVAALGMKFYTGSMFPAAYKNRIFIAEHGSWNRTSPLGYRIMTVMQDGSHASNYEVFAEGWLQNGSAWGRPVDVLQLPDGSLLVSDDMNDAIYRITYSNG